MRWTPWVMFVSIVGCGSVKKEETPDAPSQLDAPGQVDATSPGPACDPAKPFATPVEVPVLHNAGANDTHATLSADELTIYFASDRQGATPHIFTSTRASRTAPFEAPTLLGATFSNEGESHPSVSPDGNTIYFDSFRVMMGTVHIFTSTRSSAAVVFPPATMITGNFLTHPAITSDGKVLYAANLSSGGLVRMDRVGGGFGAPADVALPSAESVVAPVTNDDLALFVAFGDTVGHSVGLSKRASATAAFPAPAAVPELAITAEVAEPSWLSSDGCQLYLTYRMTGGKTTIFVATRPK